MKPTPSLLALFGLAPNPHKSRGWSGYATRYSRVLDRSKYTPHQGKREKLRRRIGGFYKSHRSIQLAP